MYLLPILSRCIALYMSSDIDTVWIYLDRLIIQGTIDTETAILLAEKTEKEGKNNDYFDCKPCKKHSFWRKNRN